MNNFARFALVVCLIAGSAHAAIYTWVDGKGVRHYSDSPNAAGAKRADLPGLQAADGNADALSELQSEARTAADTPANPGDARATVITQPRDGQTFRDAQGRVPVAVAIGGRTTLSQGEQIAYYLDGSPIPNSPTTLTQLSLGNVSRGGHTLSAALLYQGREVKRTTPLTFYMQPPSAISPLNAGQGGKNDSAGVAGADVAPPAGNATGVLAAPRFNTGSAAAGKPSS